MKTTLRLPTQDQYAYIELEIEANSTEDAIEAYNQAMRLIKPSGGLLEAEFNVFLDKYLETSKGDVNVYNEMSKPQQDIIQTLKRAFKRIEYKNK